MTAPTRSSTSLFNSAVTASGTTTKATAAAATTPVTGNGGWKDLGSSNGGIVGVAVMNNASAPSTALAFTVQVSDANDGSGTIIDLWSGAGDVAPNSITTANIRVPAEFRYCRVLGYGNQTNDVNLKATAFMKA